MSERIPMIPPFRVISRVQILAEIQDYNHEMMNVPAMWKHTRGVGIRVAILDTGMPKHLDLMPAGGKSFIPGYEFDANGHSSHCGGIVAGIANNELGISGIAPDCEDYYGAVLDAQGSGEISQIVAGIRWAVDEIGANIISMSLGIPSGYPIFKELEDAVNYADSKGVAVICAAGNEASGVGQPACYDSAIAVAAVNSRKEKAWFSNQGPQIDFAAGGVDVYSTWLNNGYAKLSGTSMACPAIAGVAALILSDEKKDTGKMLTPNELVEKMKRISYDVGGDGFDQLYGNGIPVFHAGEPDSATPPQPQPTPPTVKKSAFPCGLTWKVLRAFADGADKAARDGADPDGAILAGLRSVGEFANLADNARQK